MTTQPVTQKKRQKEFQAILSNIDTVDQNGQPYKSPVLVFPPQPGHGGKHPVRLAVEKERADKVTKGTFYRVIIEQGDAKKEAPRFDTDWYWDIVSIEPVTVAQTPATVPAAAPKQAQSATSGPETGKALPQQRSNEFRTPAQIMRCLALEVAGRNLDALIGSRQEIPDEYVLERAAVYARFLEFGEAAAEEVAAAPPPSTPPQPSTPQPEAKESQPGASQGLIHGWVQGDRGEPCPRHHRSMMRQDRRGERYCSAQVNGGYCNWRPLASAPIQKQKEPSPTLSVGQENPEEKIAKMNATAFWKAAGGAGENENSIELKLGKKIPSWLRDNPGKGYEDILKQVLETGGHK